MNAAATQAIYTRRTRSDRGSRAAARIGQFASHMLVRRLATARAALLPFKFASRPPASVSINAFEPALLDRQPHSAPCVLLVDNDCQIALALSALLMPEARVTHVPTLSAARALLQREMFSLAVIDPALPDGDAASLLPALVATPVLVYSVHNPDWRGPITQYLPKPWTSPRQLWTTISTMLGNKQPHSAGD